MKKPQNNNVTSTQQPSSNNNWKLVPPPGHSSQNSTSLKQQAVNQTLAKSIEIIKGKLFQLIYFFFRSTLLVLQR
jgi:hypothetical protein